MVTFSRWGKNSNREPLPPFHTPLETFAYIPIDFPYHRQRRAHHLDDYLPGVGFITCLPREGAPLQPTYLPISVAVNPDSDNPRGLSFGGSHRSATDTVLTDPILNSSHRLETLPLGRVHGIHRNTSPRFPTAVIALLVLDHLTLLLPPPPCQI